MAKATKESIGTRIRSIRLGKGWSQQSLGEAIGLTGASAKVQVSQWELGSRAVPVDMLIPIAEALGATPNDILGWKPGKSPRSAKK